MLCCSGLHWDLTWWGLSAGAEAGAEADPDPDPDLYPDPERQPLFQEPALMTGAPSPAMPGEAGGVWGV